MLFISGPSYAIGEIFRSPAPFTMFNVFYDSPRSFFYKIQDHAIEHYESDHPMRVQRIAQKSQQCNPSDILEQLRQRNNDGFDICLRYMTTAIFMGAGAFDIASQDQLNRSISSSGGLAFTGGKISFPKQLHSLLNLEGYYLAMPELRDGDSILEDIRDASAIWMTAYTQKRLAKSSWSYRLGLWAAKIPTFKNLNESLFAIEADVEYRNALAISPFIGLKFSPFRRSGQNHYLSFDVGHISYADQRFFNEPLESYFFQSKIQYNLSRRLSVFGQVKKYQFYDSEDALADGLLSLAGVQLYLF